MLRFQPREFIKLIDGRSRTVGGERVRFASIVQLPLSIGSYLPTLSTDVLLGTEYAKKIVLQHDLKYEDLLEIPHLIETAAIIKEKPQHLSFLGQERNGSRLFNFVIKSNVKRDEVWVATLHQIRMADLNRKLKRAQQSGNSLRDFEREFDE